MKKIMVAAMLFSISISIISCSNGTSKVNTSQVPPTVIAAFNAKYPDAAGTEWKTEKSDNKLLYEAAFKSGGKEIEAEFYENGTFKQED